jgi:hypothetical protein
MSSRGGLAWTTVLKNGARAPFSIVSLVCAFMFLEQSNDCHYLFQNEMCLED